MAAHYLDFCHKYAFEPTDRNSLPHFVNKLCEKNQPASRREQARHAVSLYDELNPVVWSVGASTRGANTEPPRPRQQRMEERVVGSTPGREKTAGWRAVDAHEVLEGAGQSHVEISQRQVDAPSNVNVTGAS